MRITRLPQWIFVATAVVLAGCAREQSPATTSDAAPPPGPPLPSLSAEPSTPPPPTAAAGLAGTPPPAAGAGGATSEIMLEDEEGNPIKDSLQIMQRAVDLYNEMRFESVSEETDQPWPPLKDLSQLVKHKILARLPAPPPGKVWSLDPAGKKVTPNAR